MTKQQEIDTLKAVSATLGPDSYIGPWLDSVLPIVELEIIADMPPTPTWGELRDEQHAVRVHIAALKAESERQAAVDRDLQSKEYKLNKLDADLKKQVSDLRDKLLELDWIRNAQ